MSDRLLKPFPFTPAPQLVADVGGTNTRLALADHGIVRPGSIKRYENAGVASLESIVERYLHETASPECAGVCVALAGPVRGDSATMTNLSWTITAGSLGEAARTSSVHLLNDLQAQGHSLPILNPHHCRVLVPGRPEPRAALLAVGAGTGFNAAPVHWVEGKTFVAAAEAGHIHLPTGREDEVAFARHLAHLHGIASIEEALCGRGLVAMHEFLTGERSDGQSLTTRIAQHDAGTQETASLYARLLGRVLAGYALTHLPFGGIYLIGGVARAMAPVLMRGGMHEAFRQMGRFSEFMDVFAISVVEDDYAALMGCATYLEARTSA
ncbi:MAG: glucokinase [Paracoccaceae bacterium]